MKTAQITFGSQTFTFNTDTLAITSPTDVNTFVTASREAKDRTSFGDNDDVFEFDPVFCPELGVNLDCLIFTGGDNYVGDYDATVENYEA